MKKNVFEHEREFIKNRHSCSDIKQALVAGYLNTNGIGCFIRNEEYFNIPIFYCPFCGKSFNPST